MIARLALLLLLVASPAWAFPTTPVLDTAIRADQNPIASGWSGPIRPIHVPLQLLSNGITGVTDGNNHSSYWSAAAFGPGSEVYAKLKTIPASADFAFFVYLRINNPNTASITGYAFTVRRISGSWSFTYNRSDTGPLVTLSGDIAGPALAAGDQIGAQMIGNQFIIFTKLGAGAWTALDGGVTDTTYSGGGFIGVRIPDDTIAIESFGGGTAGSTDTIPPTTPTGLGASATSSSKIALSWTASTDETAVPNYRIERAPFSGSCGAYVEIASQPTTTYIDANLTGATTYCHRVRATDGVNFSGYSNVTTTTTLAYRTAVIDWNDNSPNAQNATSETGFELQRCEGVSCSQFVPLAQVGSNVTHYVDATSPAPIAGYRVTALPAGNGYSNIIYTSPSTPPAVLAVSPPSLSFASAVGAGPPPTQPLTISNGGGTGMTWTVSDDGAWLSVAPTGGTDNAVITVSVDPATWIFCANESQTCTVPSPTTVRYGANGAFFTQAVTSSVLCANSVFGDPIVGVAKTCEYRTDLAAGTYNATITVTAPGANGSPASIPVQLILAPGSPGGTPGSGGSGRIR